MKSSKRRALFSRAIGASHERNGLVFFALFALICVTFVVLNLRAALLVPPWVDEVMQVDAAVNLLLGHGWTSTAWQSQSQHEFWAANNPLYTVLVYAWILVFGFSALAVRSLNYALALTIAFLIVDACRRSQWLRTLWAQTLLVVLLLCDLPVTFVYRNGRADLITMLAVVILWWIYACVKDPARRRKYLFIGALPVLSAGLHAVPYIALLCFLECLVSKNARSKVPDLIAVSAGFVAGCLLLAAVYLSQHSLRAYVSQTFISGYNIVGAALQAAAIHDSAAVGRLLNQLAALSPLNVIRVASRDVSLVPLVIFLILISALAFQTKRAYLRPPAIGGLLAAILIPFGMLAAGRYTFYYAWMSAAPVITICVITVELLWLSRGRLIAGAGIAAAFISIALGLPSELFLNERREFVDDQIFIDRTDPLAFSQVRQIVQREVAAGDVLYGDPVLYYAAKEQGTAFVSTSYAGGRGYRSMVEVEKTAISVVVVRPDKIRESIGKIGGSWSRGAMYQLAYGFSLVVLRRSPPPNGEN